MNIKETMFNLDYYVLGLWRFIASKEDSVYIDELFVIIRDDDNFLNWHMIIVDMLTEGEIKDQLYKTGTENEIISSLMILTGTLKDNVEKDLGLNVEIQSKIIKSKDYNLELLE
jgi:hypothetical protein